VNGLRSTTAQLDALAAIKYAPEQSLTKQSTMVSLAARSQSSVHATLRPAQSVLTVLWKNGLPGRHAPRNAMVAQLSMNALSGNIQHLTARLAQV